MALDQPFCVICFCDLPQPGLCSDCKKVEEEKKNELTLLIRRALDACGYQESLATPEELASCLYDFADAGVFSNLGREEVEDLTVEEMAWGLIRYCK